MSERSIAVMLIKELPGTGQNVKIALALSLQPINYWRL